jgi:SAM-dependent methyltransferase
MGDSFPVSSRPHQLDLYRLAVQHPMAEVAFLLRPATRLREDFAGTAAVAAAWVAMHEEHRALAVEAHGPTARWAGKRAAAELGPRAGDLHLIEGDVRQIAPPDVPKVDVVAALNFSSFIYHDRASLGAYLAGARRCLRAGGIVALDAYGGPGAMRVGVQRRRVIPPTDEGIRPFDYEWDQRAYDAVTGRVDCRIHFRLAGGQRREDAFRYDWRLWTLPELREAMLEAGYRRVDVWCDDVAGRDRTGRYRPRTCLSAREDWVAYVIGVR